MEIKSSWVIILIAILLLTLTLTLVNIQNFMKSEKKCESAFNMINKCGCIPEGDLTQLFHVNKTSYYTINSTNLYNETN
jgi:uncharacterized protein YpmB